MSWGWRSEITGLVGMEGFHEIQEEGGSGDKGERDSRGLSSQSQGLWAMSWGLLNGAQEGFLPPAWQMRAMFHNGHLGGHV